MPRDEALRLLGVTQAKAKMWEFGVPETEHIAIVGEPAQLFDFAISSLGEESAAVNGDAVAPPSAPDSRFAELFFDAYRRSRLGEDQADYTSLLAACAFRLFDMPGTAALLAGRLLRAEGRMPDALQLLCAELLLPEFAGKANYEGAYARHVRAMADALKVFEADGTGRAAVTKVCSELRADAYRSAGPRDLLLSDLASALCLRRVEDSVWTQLPEFSGIPAETWQRSLGRPHSIRTLWPSQKALGEAGVYRGESAVVQMPTSAGKTRSVELVIRSAFFAGRADMAAVVAPFRALCHEIRRDLERALDVDGIEVKELPDVLQMDAETAAALGGARQVLVMTPEKLLVTLRHAPELAERLGLVVYDEGHLFDDPHRGVGYELLLSSIKRSLPESAQTLLISAALPNVQAIAEWLLGDGSKTVQGAPVTPARSVGFVSWLQRRARVEFPEIQDIQPFEYFVPRVLASSKLNGDVSFPRPDQPNEIALALATRLAQEGAVAVFCGRKDTAAKIISLAIDLEASGLSLDEVARLGDEEELERIASLLEANLGRDDSAARAARRGILCHHASIPQGLRVAIEYALREGKARVVVCTSTLAQGVNLPIRYLLMTSFYQAGELMRTRDFVNLMGRAGRADQFTEGSIIFTDRRVIDRRNDRRDRWMWNQSLELIDQELCEDCSSALLTLVKPILSDNGRNMLSVDPLELVRAYLEDDVAYMALPMQLPSQRNTRGFSRGGVAKQLNSRLDAMRAVQSFLLAQSELLESEGEHLSGLVESTLAWGLASEHEQRNLRELFGLLWQDVATKVPSIQSRLAFGKTSLTATECARIEAWLSQSLQQLEACEDADGLCDILWPVLLQTLRHRTVANSDRPELVLESLKAWLRGEPFHVLASLLAPARMQSGAKAYRYKTPDVVDMCQTAFGYQASLVLGAVIELLAQMDHEVEADRIAALQRRLKHGVPNEMSYALCEMGFSDRVIAQQLANVLDGVEPTRESLRAAISKGIPELNAVAESWPLAFRTRLTRLAKRPATEPGEG